MSIVAGTGQAGFDGDAARDAATAKLNNPYGVAVDDAGNVYIAGEPHGMQCVWCMLSGSTVKTNMLRRHL
jgi:hypothetical protein